MKLKNLLSLFGVCMLLTVSLQAQVLPVTETQAGISQRLQQEIALTKDPALGYVPKSRLVQAYQERQSRIASRNLLGRAALFNWTERGPYTDAVGPGNGNTRPGNGITSGRIRAIWEDLNDATGKTVWIGGIDGGIWKTNDITAQPATWIPIDDFFGNLAVSSICQDPSNKSILYFSTGEKSLNSDAVRGAGIWQSTDGGQSWSVMPGTELFYNVSKIACDNNGNLYVGNNTISGSVGMQRYTKATANWTNITPTGLATRISDIEMSSTGTLHITCGYYNTPAASAGYRYTTNPETVTSSTWTTPASSFNTQYNVELASAGSIVYALISSSTFQVNTIYKSTNGGANWTLLPTMPVLTSQQGWYCMALAVDPSNSNNLIAGSLDCFKSTNGGTSWKQISNWVGTTGQYVHADQQAMSWRNNNQVLIASDGGIFYSANGGTTITDRNEGIRIKQFYSVAIHPTLPNYFLAGAQDNGTHQLNGSGLTSSLEVTGGDGAFVHIDQNEPQYQWGSYIYNQYRRSTNSGGSWSSINYSSTAGQFINPSDYDNTNNIMYASGNANTFVRWSNPQTGSTFAAVSMTALNGGKITALKVSEYLSNTVYFAGGANSVVPTLVKATSANAIPLFTNITGSGMNLPASARFSCVQEGTSDQVLVATLSNYGINNVYVSNNAGASWTAVDGNLPDMPVRWAMFYPGDDTKLILATETGVWQTELLNGSATIWDPETGFPNVRTDMFQYRASDKLIAVATHGRGIFTANFPEHYTVCAAPTNLNTTAINTNSATINYNAISGALNYSIEYKINTSSTWIMANSATTSTSETLTGLTANTLYDYRVKVNCASGSSPYAQSQFTTNANASCGNVLGLTANNITTNAATISWTAVTGANNYSVDYKLTTTSIWTVANAAVTTTSLTLSGLSEGTLYDFRVKANCTGASGNFAQAQFTTGTATVCPGPLDVGSNGTYKGAATLPADTDAKGTINTTSDADWYKIIISTGGTATLDLTGLPADYDMTLYNSNGKTQLAVSQQRGTTNETITRTYSAGTYYVKINGYNGANNVSCYNLRLTLGTATQHDILNVTETPILVKVFPNPTTQKISIYVVGDNLEKKMTITDALGKTIYKQSLNEMISTFDLQRLAKGIYYLNITNANGRSVYSEKIIKQ